MKAILANPGPWLLDVLASDPFFCISNGNIYAKARFLKATVTRKRSGETSYERICIHCEYSFNVTATKAKCVYCQQAMFTVQPMPKAEGHRSTVAWRRCSKRSQ